MNQVRTVIELDAARQGRDQERIEAFREAQRAEQERIRLRDEEEARRLRERDPLPGK